MKRSERGKDRVEGEEGKGKEERTREGEMRCEEIEEQERRGNRGENE